MEPSVNYYYPLNMLARTIIFVSNTIIAITLIRFYFRNKTNKMLSWWIRMGLISVFLFGISSLSVLIGNEWLRMSALVSTATVQIVIAYQIWKDSTYLFIVPIGSSTHTLANRIQAEILRRTVLEEDIRNRNERMRTHAKKIEDIMVRDSERTRKEIDRVKNMIANKNLASKELESMFSDIAEIDRISKKSLENFSKLSEFFRVSLLNAIEQLHYLNNWIGSRNEVISDIRNIIDNIDNGP